jgi:hypothetical protein
MIGAVHQGKESKHIVFLIYLDIFEKGNKIDGMAFVIKINRI